MEAAVPYPQNLVTTDHRSPEYPHHDRDEAEYDVAVAQGQVSAAVDEICFASCKWEDIAVTDAANAEAADLAQPIAALATEFLKFIESGASGVRVQAAQKCLELAQRLMKLRLTTQSAYLHRGLADESALLDNSLRLIERAEGVAQ
jgi:hypothetical protein